MSALGQRAWISASPAMQEEGGGISSMPLEGRFIHGFCLGLCPHLHISEFASKASTPATILNISDSPFFVMTVIFDKLRSFSSSVFIILFKEMVTVLCCFCSVHETSVPKESRYFAVTQ